MTHFLTDAQFRTLTALCDTLIPAIEREDDPHGFWKRTASELEVPRLFARAVRELQSEAQQRELKQLLDALNHPLTAGALTGRFRPFAALAPEAREKILQAWAASPVPQLRRAFQGLKRLTCALFYSATGDAAHNPNWPAIGYPGPFTTDIKPGKPIMPLEITSESTLACDVVVIGSGAGGGVVAGELARAGKDVIVIEKGGYYAEADFDGDEYRAYQRLYENQGLLTTRDLSVIILAGSALGGGTLINWAASFRTPEHVLEEWEREHACNGYAGPEFQESLNAVCERLHVNVEESWPSREAHLLERGCDQLGYGCGVVPRNVQGCGECGWCPFGCAAGAKQSTLKTYLQEAADHGARFLVNAYCRKVLIENERAVGAEAQVGPHLVTVRAKAVVVAAGSLHSPALLTRSGLTNPNLGLNLRLHPSVPVYGEYAEPVEMWRGPMLARYTRQFANLDGQNYGVTIQHPPAHPGVIGLGQVWRSGAQHKEAMSRAAHLAVFYAITRDRDSGRVVVDKDGRPHVHYTLSAYDRKHMARGVEALIELHAAAGAQCIGSPQSGVEPHRAGDDLPAFLQRIRARGFAPNGFMLFSAHQMGTCRMSGHRSKAVLTPQGESWDVRGLYVADASTFPTCSGVNPMITIMAVAHKTAQVVKGRV
jgi:choline dehydrogenase-like flavoprotein